MVGAAQRSRGYRIPHLELHGRWWPGGRQDGHSQHAPRPQTAGAEWIFLLFLGCWLLMNVPLQSHIIQLFFKSVVYYVR